ncbi:MAG TPA: DUF167 domain-containing protein [Firmicutes bacterium]|nr:DUF167 domain-containing protein [Bacillota bacterium]
MSEISISETGNSVEFDVIVKPKARNNAILGVHDNAIRIGVSAAPEKGKANDAVIKLLSKLLKIPVSDIQIESGETSRRKRIKVIGVKPEEIKELIKEQS